MINSFLKKWLPGFSLLAVVTYTVIHACGYAGTIDVTGYAFSSFTPQAYVAPSYLPLFFLDKPGYSTDYNSRFNDDIVSDWDAYLNGKIDKEELRYFMVEDSAGIELENLYEVAFKKRNRLLQRVKSI